MERKSAFDMLDVDEYNEIDSAAAQASYEKPGGANHITKKIAGQSIYGKRISIDNPAETVVFSENPRLLEGDQDVTELSKLVYTTGTNNTPVDARLLANGKVEIIAGSRRRLACIKAGVPLTADVYENVDDRLARLITHMENSERENISTLADCIFLYNTHEKYLVSDTDHSIERLGAEYGVSKSLIYDKVAVGALAKEFRDVLHSFASWTLTKAIALKKYINKLRKADVPDARIRDVLASNPVPQSAIAALIAELDKEGQPAKVSALKPATKKIGKAKITVSSSSKSSFSISVTNAKDAELIRRFEEFLATLEE